MSEKDNNTNRIKAAHEAKEDLKKPLEQLLTDIFEEINSPERPINENIIHSQKRFYSMMANVAASNNKLSKRILWLTVITALLAAIQASPIIYSWFYCK